MATNTEITVYQKENEVVKNNGFIRCSNNLTTIQRKSFAIMLKSTIDKIRESGEERYYYMPLFQYRELMGHPDNMPTKYIAAEIEELMTKIIRWDIKPNGKGVRSVMLAAFEIVSLNNINFLKWDFSNFLIDKLIADGYTPLKLSIIMDFSSKYSLALYENLQMFKNFKKYTYSLQEFRALMGVEENEHPRMEAFKRTVLTPALIEINNKSDMKIFYEDIKQGAKIVGFKFDWIVLTQTEITERDKKREKTEKYLDVLKEHIGQKYIIGGKKYTLTKEGLVYRSKIVFDFIDSYELISNLKKQGLL